MVKKGTKQSESHKAKINTPERARKISETMKKKYSSGEISSYWKNKKQSIESNLKRSIGVKRIAKSGKDNVNYKGGKIFDSCGYIKILCPEHPYCDSQNYVREHRLVMEKHLGRTLLPTEVVHHINMDRADNRIENLMLFSNDKEHLNFHRNKRWKN